MSKTATIDQVTENFDNNTDADNLLNALGKMQVAFLKAFRHNPEYLTPLHWNMCIGLWCARNSKEPLEKEAVLEWRFEPDPDDPKKRNYSQAIVGDNKARDHLDLLRKDGFVYEDIYPDINKRKKYIRGTDKLNSIMEEVLTVAVDELKRSFK